MIESKQTSAPSVIARSLSAPVLIKAIAPLVVELHLGEALVAGMSMQVLARHCPDESTAEALVNVGKALVTAARAMCATAAVEVEEIKKP